MRITKHNIALATTVTVLAQLLTSSTAVAASDYCRQVIAKPASHRTPEEVTKCQGPLIAAALCEGWTRGKRDSGCPDRKTSLAWLKSSEPERRRMGDACTVGSAVDRQCGF